MPNQRSRSSSAKHAEIDIPQWLRKLPKVELHLHLEGTIEPETLVALSRRHDADPLTLDAARKLYTYENFLGFLQAFKAVTERLQTPEDYELITYNMVRALAAQGVLHAEVYISFGILYFWRKVAVEPYVEAVERRSHVPSIVGIGIGGDEARGPASLFKEHYAEARQAGLRLTAHAGESGGPLEGPRSIWGAINISAERSAPDGSACREADPH